MVNEINKILVPLDFSRNQDRFLKIVADVALRHHAKIHFLHVVKSGLLGTGSAFSGKFYYHGKALLDNSRSQLNRTRKKFESLYKIPVETATAVGSVAACIADYAAEHCMSLIILGVRYPGKRPGFVSSNSYEIISSSIVPVLSVPSVCTRSDFSEVLYPVRHTEGVMAKLDPVLPIALKNDSEIRLQGIASEKKQAALSAVTQTVSALQDKLREEKLKCHVGEIVFSENPEEEILKQSEQCDADLLAVNVTTEKPLTKIFKNNFTENIIYKSKIPVLFCRKPKTVTALEQYTEMPYPVFPV